MRKDTFVPRGKDKLAHSRSCADLFVSLFNHVDDWQWEVEIKISNGKKDKVFRPDRTVIFKGKKFYFEIDRSTEPPSKILGKLDNYVKHYHETKEEFYVVFTVQDYRSAFGKMRTSADKRIKVIGKLFDQRRLADNFFVLFHDDIVKAPFKVEFYSRFGKSILSQLVETKD